MNDTAIKNFCIWARRELIEQVAVQARRYGIREDGYDPASADAIEGRLLSADERRQRAELIRRLGPADASSYKDAYEKLIDQAAYTWFNRMVAIRFMELNDRLPSHVRVLSADDGSFRPQVIREALDIEIDGLDAAEVSALVAASDDEALFRCLFLAQCRELSTCLPDVFEPVGAAMELLLPENLLRPGSVLERLVEDIPDADWRDGVEVVGWMYQYYAAERKDEVFAGFKKGKKADASAIAPATQLFTPNWIVQYLTQNSLGRLWMQSHPDSNLTEKMPYYIPDDLGIDESEDATNVILSERSKPKDPPAPVDPTTIKVIDPACGSGHILVYAFRLLAAMYEEAGHARRDIPRLILANNLTGCEIDPRAAQIASFALAMEACELDSRYLRRAERAVPRIVCLLPAQIDDEELEQMPYLAQRKQLLDAMAHMGECGSLFAPEPEDIQALLQADDEFDAREAGGDLLAHAPHSAVRQMLANCEPLAETYDAVIANPPYMGSSNMDKCLAAWTKKNYPDSKRDLCTCFIERGFTLARPDGYSAMVTMQSWMFLGSFEALREKMLSECSIASMAHLGTRAFDAIGGEVVATTATVFRNKATNNPAGYLRLVDFDGEAAKEKAIREAIDNPTCGWFYRRPSDSFKSIPGTPIAYWASEAMTRAFDGSLLGMRLDTRVGMATADNDSFVRVWWEPSLRTLSLHCCSLAETYTDRAKWYPYTKGGDYRKWYGNREYCVDWQNDGAGIRANRDEKTGRIRSHNYNDEYSFLEHASWSYLSSGHLSLRYIPLGSLFDSTSGTGFSTSLSDLLYCIALCNSSVADSYLSFLAPTLAFKQGEIERIPDKGLRIHSVSEVVRLNYALSRADYDSFENSWDFKRHPMV